MAEVRKTGILGLGDYIKTFSDGLSPTKKENVRVSSNYYGPILSDYEMYDKFCGLNDDEYEIDTDLEWALASYYSNAVVRVRPIEADAILPANNPRTAGLKLGSAVLKELAELKFLDPSNTAAIGRYEGMIKFISDKNGVSRADIEKYLKDGIVAVVDAEFNKTRFGLGDYSTDKYYSTTLARNTQTQYILSYEGYFSGIEQTKQITAPSLNALLTEMKSGANKADFDQGCIEQVRAEAANIPAVFLAKTGKDPRADLAACCAS